MHYWVGIVSGMLHGCTILCLVWLLLLTTFEAYSVGVTGCEEFLIL